MNKIFTLRRLNAADCPTYFALRLESLQSAPTSFMSSFEEEKQAGAAVYEQVLQKKEQDDVIFGAFCDDHLVGAVGLYRGRFSRIRHKANIWGMYVQSNYRNNGIGKMLLQTAIDHAILLNCQVACISVETQNPAAIQFYTTFGFTIWGTEPRSMLIEGNYHEEHHMLMFLIPAAI
jgi:GNAT superfamily N-acetyltransferase